MISPKPLDKHINKHILVRRVDVYRDITKTVQITLVTRFPAA